MQERAGSPLIFEQFRGDKSEDGSRSCTAHLDRIQIDEIVEMAKIDSGTFIIVQALAAAP